MITEPLRPFNTIGKVETMGAITAMMNGPLSGYLAGRERGGRYVRGLEDLWCEMFHVKHAIACNSATSGLMAAAFAVGLKRGDLFLCPAMTMSATAAAPMFTGAEPMFGDVDGGHFSLATRSMLGRAIFLTHLFGLAVNERWWAEVAHQNGIKLVVDASQAPFARCDDVLAGTQADIGVFSLNVHKHVQCGEGGICVTNDDMLALKLRNFINHGENLHGPIGLNLRMPEVCAAIALVQLRKSSRIISWRIEQAEAIIDAIGVIPGIAPPHVPDNCRHVFYAIPFLINGDRATFCAALRAQGVPITEGYVPPLYRLPAFKPYARPCLVAEDLHDRRLFFFENCAYDATPEQIKQIGETFHKASEKMK